MLELDLRGLTCPLPLLKTKQALNQVEPGMVVTVHATDPGSWKDFHSFCELSGNELLKAEEREDGFFYQIEKRQA